ncbi:MAG: hypothetical protein NTW49_02125 [Bacteroidia bacterium]|nr:hypothetical protein [Bacteroidia bacterium]
MVSYRKNSTAECNHNYFNPNCFLSLIITGILSISLVGKAYSQDLNNFDEISVYLNVQGVGGLDVSAITNSHDLFLSVNEVFDFLKIRNVASQGYDTLSGFFINQESEYLIDRINHEITYQNTVYDLKPEDIMHTETGLYLKLNYFGEIFGLECTFNFRSLSVNLKTKLELPVIREMKMKQLRNNISRLKGEIKADTVIHNNYPLFKLGTADWSVNATQEINKRKDARLGLNLGSILLGGETNMSVNYQTGYSISERQLNYNWHYVNNENTALRQVFAGKISARAISTIYAPVLGLQFTNTPTTYRRSFGTYTLSDYTDPGWLVELYVNNVLVDYIKADALGFYSFEIPLVYGNTTIKLRFYGPWGEERSSEQNISIPFEFLPVHEFEYSVNGGMVEDGHNSIYSQTNINYGLNHRITMGGGMEYLSSVSSGKFMPYLGSSVRLTSNILLNGQYVNKVLSKAIMTYHLPSSAQLEFDYIRYAEHQTAINNNMLEERKVIISFPLKVKEFLISSRLKLGQAFVPGTKYENAELLLSGLVAGVSTNLTTSAVFLEQVSPNVNSNLFLGFRLPKGVLMTTQTQYDFQQNQFMSLKLSFEKHFIGNGFMNVSYEKFLSTNAQTIEFGLRYDFNFAETDFSVRSGTNSTLFVEYAKGSLLNEGRKGHIKLSNRSSVGKGGLIIVPFFDLNNNGQRDPGESKVAGLTMHMNGGRTELRPNDTTILVNDLEPYTNYFIEIDPASLNNIAWHIRKPVISISVDPNCFRLLEIPVNIVGEVSGTVYLNDENGKKGQERIIVGIYDEKGQTLAKVMTESDGFFSYLGLAPGSYLARIDSAQLQKLQMTAIPASSKFSIKMSMDGDVVDNLEFIIEHITKTPDHGTKPDEKEPVEKEKEEK